MLQRYCRLIMCRKLQYFTAAQQSYEIVFRYSNITVISLVFVIRTQGMIVVELTKPVITQFTS